MFRQLSQALAHDKGGIDERARPCCFRSEVVDLAKLRGGQPR
jgi:hypothetical protein